MIEIVAGASSLTRGRRGTIMGQVFLRGPTGDFPRDGWSDFAVVILCWWIEGLTEIVAGRERSFQGEFMDGPYAFIVKLGAGKSGRIAWGRRGEEVSIGIIDVAALLGSAVAAGKLVAAACRARHWAGRDLDKLERAIARSAAQHASMTS